MTQDSETPNVGIPAPPIKTGMSTGRLVAIVTGIVLLLGVLCVLIMLPVVRQKNHALAREQARNNGRELVSAVQRQHKDFNRLPANTVDADGEALLSWRFELLFYLGQQMVGEHIDRSIPWNSTGHHTIRDQVATLVQVPVFQSPRGLNDAASITHFVCVTDPASPMSGERIKLEAIDQRDGTSNTALFLEYPASDINWAEPRDVTLAEAIDIIQNSSDSYGTVVAMADGKSIVVPKTASTEDITKLFLLDNGAPHGTWWNEK